MTGWSGRPLNQQQPATTDRNTKCRYSEGFAVLESPSGALINPLFIRSVSKQKHFWSDKFYLTLFVQGGGNIEYEQLSSSAADDLMKRIAELVSECINLATAYDEAYEGGRSHGYDSGSSFGYSEGYSNGFQEAKNAFWSYDREEYRINDYNVGYEAGKRDTDERMSDRWSQGYNYWRDEANEEISSGIAELRRELTTLRSSNRNWRKRALLAEGARKQSGSDTSSFTQDVAGRYSALRRSLAKLFHPDNSAGSTFEKAIRQEIFKEVWSEIEIIEKRFPE